MRTYPFRIPYILTRFFSGLVWRVDPTREKTIYLTFDDGPHPEVTPYVLDLLKEHAATATFFVVGENAEKYPEVLDRIQTEGHRIGNHTYHHLSGWGTSRRAYQQDVQACEMILSGSVITDHEKLFRPPYGRITPGHIRNLKQEYQIVMWSLLSGDFDRGLDIKASRRALDGAGPGEVIVFHDSEKSLPNLKQLLPWFLERFQRKGFKFAPL